jgi:hypothetical protein
MMHSAVVNYDLIIILHVFTVAIEEIKLMMSMMNLMTMNFKLILMSINLLDAHHFLVLIHDSINHNPIIWVIVFNHCVSWHLIISFGVFIHTIISSTAVIIGCIWKTNFNVQSAVIFFISLNISSL